MNHKPLSTGATLTATAKSVVGFNALTATGDHAAWSTHEPLSYVNVTHHSGPTYSGVGIGEPVMTPQEFARRIAAVYAALARDQEPLGAEFEAVWDENLESLYQS